MHTDVTIAILIHNALEFLKTTIHSIKRNTRYPYALLLIDDASDQVTKSYISSLHNATLITNRRQMGFPHNANLAIDRSATPYIVLLNSDTYVTQNWLTLLINCLKEKSCHGIAGPSTSFAWGGQRIIDRPNWTHEEIERFGMQTYQKYGNQIQYLDRLHSNSGFCYAFKRQLVEDIGYFDEAYGLGQCEEIDYNTRAARAGFRCVWVCGAYVHHFGGKSFPQATAIKLLQKNKEIYQNKFCSLKIKKLRTTYCSHCNGEECEHFTKPEDLKRVLRKATDCTFEYLS